jgi:large subunit ribosomal protein L10
MERAQKDQIVEDLAGRLSRSEVSIVADYQGLSVLEFNELRKSLRDGGSIGQVFKNTLVRRSAKQSVGDDTSADFEKFLGSLKGPTLVITSEKDPVSPAKTLAEFIKAKQKVKVKGAWLDGKFLDESAFDQLSKMPGKEEILGQLLALINTPATQLLRLINTPATQVTRVIDAQREKLQQAA